MKRLAKLRWRRSYLAATVVVAAVGVYPTGELGQGLSAPTITTQPANQTAIIGSGQPVTVTIAAAGNPVPSYQWQASGNGGVSWSNLTNSGPYSGVATPTLTLRRRRESTSTGASNR